MGIACESHANLGLSGESPAAIAHLAHSTPQRNKFTATDFNSYVTMKIADGAPQRIDGTMQAASKPGLGIEPIADVLGEPVLDFQ